MGKTPTDSLLKEAGSTSRVDDLSDSISDCFIDVSLPQELSTEILVRLPMKSVFQFKCVSKSWLSFISNPHNIWSLFSKSSSMEADGLNVELLFATKTGMKKCSLYSALREREADPSTYVSPIEFQAQNPVPIVGMINGLVCLNLKGTDLCVWNPALNKIKHLNLYPETSSGNDCFFSFGYDESNDDYKVVCLQTVLRGQFRGSDAEVHIYSLKADSWKRIDDLKGFHLPLPGVFFNGKIYWSSDLFGIPKRKIVSLDMSSEKFAELRSPKYDSGQCSLRMEVSGGLLLMLVDYWDGKKLDLWVLDNHGVEESWCKLVSIPQKDVNISLRDYNFQVLCILNTGEIVFGKQYGLLVYDWEKKESWCIRLDDGITPRTRIAAYVESLVWPYNP